MATYTVSHAQMQDVIDRMGVVNGNINDLIDHLNTSTAGSLSEWTSDARDHYNASRAAWNNAAAQMNEHLARAQASLGSISEGYRAAEVQGSNMWQE
jgi:WXG100 family type VII secretion target